MDHHLGIALWLLSDGHIDPVVIVNNFGDHIAVKPLHLGETLIVRPQDLYFCRSQAERAAAPTRHS